MTRNQIEAKRRYTTLSGGEDSWTVRLVVSNQSFTVWNGKSKAEGRWFQKMLSIAVDSIIEENQPQ